MSHSVTVPTPDAPDDRRTRSDERAAAMVWAVEARADLTNSMANARIGTVDGERYAWRCLLALLRAEARS